MQWARGADRSDAECGNSHIPIALLPDGRASFDQNLHALLERKRRLMRDALYRQMRQRPIETSSSKLR